ncbi:hypothetical protein DICSQDRAFT_175433 [Dichomitus squalens LYAD-421 SS1]|uniref:Uncharacterized protein n=1 Tax=Dichomitus squalens (strain LYAD-421) TaxID=732165 RepID=R7SJ12_DICSQ|nr:uncharacterized protein DICSQDRAFT_175433 [Dichomitus squalens LYAD-421 SS1]EJF55868.1 hypothetical protein DICSQDRAFT_175433 [Dichomitus squalens LYAD-421 SS1]
MPSPPVAVAAMPTSSSTPTPSLSEGNRGHLSPKLTVTLVGSLLLFFFLVIGFRLVARKACCASSASGSNTSLPTHFHDCHHRRVYPPAARSKVAYPVASVYDKCPECLRMSNKATPASPRASLSSLPPPPPPYAAQSPTAMPRVRPTSWLPRPGSSSSAFTELDVRTSAPLAAPSTTVPTTASPSSPPPAYIASRGPTASLTRYYRRS